MDLGQMFDLSFADDHDPRMPVYLRSSKEVKQLELSEYDRQRKFQTEHLVQMRTDELLRDLATENKFVRNLRSVSPFMYNCVGMIFSSRRAWIEMDELQQIFDEDDYYSIRFEDICAGDIVIYTKGRSRRHIGLITYVERQGSALQRVLVVSKWGADGEIEHELSAVPKGYGEPTEYWSERVKHVAW